MVHRKKTVVALIVLAALVVIVLVLTRNLSEGPIEVHEQDDATVGAIDRTTETP